MHTDPMMPYFVGVMAAVVLIGALLRRFRQPHVTAYLVVGLVIGPAGLGLVEDATMIARLGEFGVVLLLFFAGMEMHLPQLLARWRVPVLGTLGQIGLSLGVAIGAGAALDWSIERSILLGFVISLSSTGVVMKYLRDQGEASTPVGSDVIGVLIVQDVAVVAMLITIGRLGGGSVSAHTLATQIVGGAAVIGFVAFLARRETVSLPFGRILRADHELQVFAAFLVAFGFALLSGLAGLSAALGAFVAGLLIGAARETRWVTESLHPFHVLFLALFFISVGMAIDVAFLRANAGIIAVLVASTLVINTIINMVAFRLLGVERRRAFYGATLLAQIGEFSFVLAAVGVQTGLLSGYDYQLSLAVIALSLFISPLWIQVGRHLSRPASKASP